MKAPSMPFLLLLYALALLFWWLAGFAPEHDQTVRIAYFIAVYFLALAGTLLVQCLLLLVCRRGKCPAAVRLVLPLLPLGALILLQAPAGRASRWLETRLQSVCEPMPHESAQVLRSMAQEIPSDWVVGASDHDLYATAPELTDELLGIIANVRAEAQALTARDTPRPAGEPQWIRIYYAPTREEYAAIYERIAGRPPPSMGGMAEFAPRPPCVFGCEEVGGGTIGHELVHVLIMRDWPTIPGWFNEALAQALGASNQSQRASGIARVSRAAGHWIPLESVVRLQDPDYSRLAADGQVVSHGGWEGTMTRLITGHAFVWWLHETGRLPAFYRAFRDTRQVTAACQAVGFSSVAAAEQNWITWLSAKERATAR